MGRPTAEARVAPTIKITDDAKFPVVTNGDAQVTNVRQSAAPAPLQAHPSRQLSSPVPLFPPVPPASQPPPDVMPRTPSLAPSAGAAMPRAVSQPPQMPTTPAPGPAPLPRSISSPPGAQGSQPRPSEGLTVQQRPSNRNLQPSGPIAARPAPAALEEPEVAPRRGGRRWGLVVILLIIDLGLAGSGGFMLLRGLAGSDGAAPTTTSQPKAP